MAKHVSGAPRDPIRDPISLTDLSAFALLGGALAVSGALWALILAIL